MEGAEGRWGQGLGGEVEGRTVVRFRKDGWREGKTERRRRKEPQGCEQGSLNNLRMLARHSFLED